MKTGHYRWLVAGLIVTGVWAGLAGCNHDLFVDKDTRSNQSLRYYDNDSATKTTQDRKQSVGMPFGMPQGGADQ